MVEKTKNSSKSRAAWSSKSNCSIYDNNLRSIQNNYKKENINRFEDNDRKDSALNHAKIALWTREYAACIDHIYRAFQVDQVWTQRMIIMATNCWQTWLRRERSIFTKMQQQAGMNENEMLQEILFHEIEIRTAKILQICEDIHEFVEFLEESNCKISFNLMKLHTNCLRCTCDMTFGEDYAAAISQCMQTYENALRQTPDVSTERMKLILRFASFLVDHCQQRKRASNLCRDAFSSCVSALVEQDNETFDLETFSIHLQKLKDAQLYWNVKEKE